MRSQFVNTALLALMLLLGITGIITLYGTWQRWVFDLHRIVGWSLIALTPWKGLIVYRSLRRGLRKEFDRSVVVIVSVMMAAVILFAVLLGVMWMWRLGPYRTLMHQTVLAWHWILGLAIFPVFAFHVWRRWPQPQSVDFASRRGVVRIIALGAAGLFGWQVAQLTARSRASQATPRRTTTGSRGFGLFQDNAFPITGEPTLEINTSEWRLRVDGAVEQPLALTYNEILSLSSRQTTHILDCTSGWYTVQDWRGVPLIDLLKHAGLPAHVAGLRLTSTTGYHHTFPFREAKRILLATHVGGEVLAPRHGYPLRAVVPERRGWFWVKWLASIEVLDSRLEVIAGMLSSPRETLRQF